LCHSLRLLHVGVTTEVGTITEADTTSWFRLTDDRSLNLIVNATAPSRAPPAWVL
jgi:hypothetical protein